MDFQKLQALVNLANDSGASENEKRNAALAACKILASSNILVKLHQLQVAFALRARSR